ncbi:MAG TPA: glycerol-3-phosphate 1-O-acyltransferase PlsY [Gammaproteobacteria bacterium]|nr:glycerol-3-phosphate 1-O-acyltransferase PlsY [Gammaproteobacteria bacterium]
MLVTTAAVLIAYLFGSISSAIIVCKLMGLPDPRTHGSRNPGATNVLRIGGKKAAAITMFGDMLKGFIPVLAAIWLQLDINTTALVMFAAFIGHLYPLYFRFEGGKGVATFIGCLLALDWQAGCAFLLTWIVVAAIFRYASLASLTAAIIAPFYVWFFTDNTIYYITTLMMSVILVYRHSSNIQKLAAGKEDKISSYPRKRESP